MHFPQNKTKNNHALEPHSYVFFPPKINLYIKTSFHVPKPCPSSNRYRASLCLLTLLLASIQNLLSLGTRHFKKSSTKNNHKSKTLDICKLYILFKLNFSNILKV